MEIASPTRVLLGPQQAELQVRQVCAVQTVEGVSSFTLYLPADARDFSFAVENQTVTGWDRHFEMVAADDNPYTGSLSSKKAALEQHVADLKARKQALAAREALWRNAGPARLTAEDIHKLEGVLQENVVQLNEEMHRVSQRLSACEQELTEMGPAPVRVQVITVQLAKKPSAPVEVRCSYTLNNCGWRAAYRFDARPDADEVQVRLHAEVWQQSGLDWTDSEIVLVSGATGPRAPAPITPWLITENTDTDAAAPRRAPELARTAAPMMNAAPPMQEQTASIRWTLPQKGLPEGHSSKILREAVWKAPLEWLARPRAGQRQVWLTFRCDVADLQSWPAGQAAFFIDGAAAGQGDFIPAGTQADLFFGADPRITVQTRAEAPRKGSDGLWDKKSLWVWRWEYTIVNGRSKPATVRLEAAAPQLGTIKGTASYDCSPTPRKTDDHTLLWRLHVPPRASSTVHYGVTVKP